MIPLLMPVEDALAGELERTRRPVLQESLEEKIGRIQAGDLDLRNQVIADSLPYIKGVLNRMLARPLIEQADEFSVALLAFNEAIDDFHAETNVPFLRFAGLVINRRVVDWLRQQRHHLQTRSFSDLTGSADESPEAAMDSLVNCPPDAIWLNMEAEEEIVQLQRCMQRFGLSFSRLTQCFPRHGDSRRVCLHAAHLMKGDPFLYRRFIEESRLPATELSRRSGIPLKTIERNRLSIIFLILILDSGLDVIKAYLRAFEREMS